MFKTQKGSKINFNARSMDQAQYYETTGIFLCEKKTKITTLFNNFFSSVSVNHGLFKNILSTFLGLECVHFVAVYAGSKALGFDQKIAQFGFANMTVLWFRIRCE